MAPAKSLKWLEDRAAGILLHPTSLHSDQAVGVLGTEARAFVDFLRDARVRYWQMLPLGPTGYGDSPYSSFSAFAGNPYLIDLKPLQANGILEGHDLQLLNELPTGHVDFGAIFKIKWPLLRLAHKRFREQKRAYLPNYGLFEDFQEAEAGWLDPFCAYMALKERFNGIFWGNWPEECRTIESARQSRYWDETAQAREAHAFFQYLFAGQWGELKAYANASGVEIIGDAPIFVALDSADVWAQPHLFEMSKPGQPDFVAGVPPDYFSKTGQLWGNPLYDWKAMQADDYAWWMDRLRANFRLFDVVRLDHFRGFYNYWRIPAGSRDARSGQWADGPQDAFFKQVARAVPEARLIAEDLGEIDDEVRAFRDRLGLPGMAILQFAFGGGADNLYLPHNLTEHSVLYPGTHDNNTSRGWYEEADEPTRDHVRRYLRISGEDLSWDFLRTAYASVSQLAIIPMQDLFALPASARMNTPGLEQGNWQWRMETDAFNRQCACAPYLRELAGLYGRSTETS
jgi:4-alpha-glucanotransferase